MKGVYMNFEKNFKVAFFVLFALAIFIYGMANRYQFFHITNSLTGLACNHYTGKCEWLSPEEMGVEKIKMYADTHRAVVEKQAAPQAPVPKPESPR
jgi:hypothetical protein